MMLSRMVKLAAMLLLTFSLCLPVLAQAQKKKKDVGPRPEDKPKPVMQYIGMVIFISLPIFLVCRSSRR